MVIVKERKTGKDNNRIFKVDLTELLKQELLINY